MSRVVPLVVALIVGAAITGAGWGLQAATLPAPRRSELIASRAAAWLFRYRLVDSTFNLGTGRPVHTTCTQTWFHLRGGLSGRGAVLRFDRSRQAVTLQPHDLDLIGFRHREPRWLPRAQLELGGCPRLLGEQIARAIEGAVPPRVTSTTVSGRPLLALRLQAAPLSLDVLLTPRTDRPVGLVVKGDGYVGRSTLLLSRVTPFFLSTRGLNQ
ncbi:MAG: hypothetical protein QOI27_1896 [Gaiellaceae bacterium]|nr:hypothetical protein [Gaiellaceae bacterium]MDX6473742.1 hypothetical protein [Gaiellaceae bacterium]